MSDIRSTINQYVAANNSVKAEREAFKAVCSDFVETVKEFSRSKNLYRSSSDWKWAWVSGIDYVSHDTFTPYPDRGELYYYDDSEGKDFFISFNDFENIKQILENDYRDYSKKKEVENQRYVDARRAKLKKELEALDDE